MIVDLLTVLCSGLQDPHPAISMDLPPVLDELYPMLLHCCHEDVWQARLAGAAAIKLLVSQLPPSYLRHWALPTLRGLLNAMRLLPEHCVMEMVELDEALTQFMRKCLFNEQPPQVGVRYLSADSALRECHNF